MTLHDIFHNVDDTQKNFFRIQRIQSRGHLIHMSETVGRNRNLLLKLLFDLQCFLMDVFQKIIFLTQQLIFSLQ